MTKPTFLVTLSGAILLLPFISRPAHSQELVANYQITDQEIGCAVAGTCPDLAEQLAEAKLEMQEETNCATSISPIVVVGSVGVEVQEGDIFVDGHSTAIYDVTINYSLAKGPKGHPLVCN